MYSSKSPEEQAAVVAKHYRLHIHFVALVSHRNVYVPPWYLEGFRILDLKAICHDCLESHLVMPGRMLVLWTP